MNWVTLAKYGIPALLILGAYFWVHNDGYNEGYAARDGKVAGEIQAAVDTAVAGERKSCDDELKAMGSISDESEKQRKKSADLYADAIGKLYDAAHGRGERAGAAAAAGSDNGPAGAGRLYYADPAGARPALDRAHTATDQAGQLIGCQAYICGVTKGKAAFCGPR